MKKIFFISLLAAVFFACNSKENSNNKPLNDSVVEERNNKMMADTASFTTIEWLDSNTVNIPKIKEGEVLEVSFHFKNTGKKPLIISKVTASCGCTVPQTPQQPFAPGEEGVIRAKFDSHGKMGLQEKAIYVTANTVPETYHSRSFRVEVTQ